MELDVARHREARHIRKRISRSRALVVLTSAWLVVKTNNMKVAGHKVLGESPFNNNILYGYSVEDSVPHMPSIGSGCHLSIPP